jgi:ribonuclease PH
VDLSVLGQRTVWVDCDVLQADGGTRTAGITGACVAAAIAFDKLVVAKKVFRSPMQKMVAAVSAGIYKKEALLDLNYEEDRDAEVDANFVMTEDGEFVEIQGAGEESTFSATQFTDLLALGRKGIVELCALQKAAVRTTRPDAGGDEIKALAEFFARK